MTRTCFFRYLFVLLNSISIASSAQTKIPTQSQVSKLTFEAKKKLKEGDFEKSLILSRLGLQQAILIKDDNLIANCYNTIASNYDEFSEYDKAIYFYKKGLSYAEKTTNDTLKNRVNNNLGNMFFFEKKQYKIGIEYYEKSIAYSSKIADTSQIIFTKINVAWAYFDINQYKAGFPHLEFANKYFDKYGDKSFNVVLNMLNGMYYGNQGDNKKADFFFLKAIALGNKSNEKADLSYSHQEYSKFLLKNGNYKEAYKNLALYNTITDEFDDQEKLKKAKTAGIDLELDEYKREINRIESEKELQAQGLKKSKIIVALFILVLFVLLLLLYLLYKNVSFKKKANTKLTIANTNLIIAKEIAEEASLLKSQFVSTISHELRTPLYGVIGITNMLLDEYKDLAKSPHLSSLKFSARYLLSLVNDILQINKIEENRVVLECLTFNVGDEIEMIKNSLSFLAQNNKNEIELRIDPKIPEYLIGDKLRFSQIIMNLLSNALKFTQNGKVIISADLIKIDLEMNFIEFKIKDTGVGIAIEDQEKIFDKFVQVGRNDSDYQGTGLGLSIVKRLLLLFNSTIAIESELGVGTTFIFTIAFEHNAEKTNEIIKNIQVDLSESAVFKVLVVEDNKINQLVTKKIMEKSHYKCSVVDDGFAALELLEKEQFDIILMDINMPLMNGFETTRKIRLQNISTPIVALTAFDKEEITEEAISSGMNDIIIKPFEPSKLFKIINALILKTKNAG
ncbi:tetratricopeptide repeat-containing hybrid sensor histidine kinase/response regulator [Flavobacterium restrictum]|uniref:histidine kinase n=1 Tax=Flavobacterium restrictum TaxID=2594428 RepID=A0A553E7F7_9FLAO|nr:response regulator [Flavobacterium restrictum]TRX40871.1 response regulator [Flavobacterium restrictum]